MMGKKSQAGKELQSCDKKKRRTLTSQTNKNKKSKMDNKKATTFFVDMKEEKENLSSAVQNWKQEDCTLQNAFLTYRKKRHARMVAAGKAAKKKKLARCGPKRMWALRLKFVQQCKKYIGTPYRRKYHEAGTAEYNSPFFLDCCGLVRRALRDLRDDFDFDLGPWNQTYMYDTLPTVVAREEHMKPGDLVFISGVYYNQKMKQQLHGIVHIEVWLGDGHKTIGARWHKGAVQIFDSYRFTSTSYHSMRYHFKSINPWLKGICRSHCPIHAWRLPYDFRPSKRSVLHVSTTDQQQNASDDDNLQNSLKIAMDQSDEASEPVSIREDGASSKEDEEKQRSNVSSASCDSSEDSQESLMKDLLLSGSDIVDLLSDQLHISSKRETSKSPAKSHHKSLAFIQVTKSIGRNAEENISGGRGLPATPGGQNYKGSTAQVGDKELNTRIP